MKMAVLSVHAAVLFASGIFAPTAIAGGLYTFSTIDGPKPGQFDGERTYVQGISDTHIIVGYAFPDSPCTNSFIIENDTATTLAIPRPPSWPGLMCMRAQGVNNSGHVVGTYGDTVVQGNGFVYHDGVFSNVGTPRLPPFPLPRTMPQGISNSGLIVGNYQDSKGEHAFVDISGYTVRFDVPGGSSTYAHGINDIGQVVGSYADAAGTHGYVNYWGSFRRLNYPGSTETIANGINDFGMVVGSYEGADGDEHGFIHAAGVFVPFDVPSGRNTVLTGINNRLQIVGSFDLPIGNKPTHGFLADPVTVVDVLNGIVRLDRPMVRVIIRSTPRFDAVASIDMTSLTFGRVGTEASLAGCQVIPGGFGSSNLACTFSVAISDIACGDTRAILTGRLLDGTPIRGSDAVRVRSCP
jgi:probable HAF family extracellular repeat protein